MRRQSILVTCGGKWAGTIYQLRRSMKLIPELAAGSIYVADQEAITPAGHYADGSFVVPPIVSSDYPNEILRICNEMDIGVVVPLIDVDLLRLTEEATRFADQGVAVVTPGKEMTNLCMDKVAFNEYLVRHEVPTPRIRRVLDLDDRSFPVFVKPRSGFGSIGARSITSMPLLSNALASDPTLIVQEQALGSEYTVDALVSSDGKCSVRVPRLREKVVGGEAVRSRTVRDDSVIDLADRIIDLLASHGYRGPLNIQIMKGQKALALEVNARIASASVLTNMATGGRYFAAVLKGAMGGDTSGEKNDFLEDLQLYRFYGELYMLDAQVIESIPVGRGDRD